MKLTLGDCTPTSDGPSTGKPAVECPAAPEGYWVNPANCTQWLPPDRATEIGGLCMFGTGIMPGRLRLAGNRESTCLVCGPMLNSSTTDALVLYGGAAAAAFFFLPSPAKYWVAGSLAAIAALGVCFGTGRN